MSKQRGFTLIELLIVIALLGVLAVGLIATIDPFEQLKKGQDTSTRNLVEEFYNASLRYYAIRNSFPWGPTLSAMPLGTDDMSAHIQAIIDQGELKQDFIDLSSDKLNEVLVTAPVADQLTVCFAPKSKSFRGDNNSKYDDTGGDYVSVDEDNYCPLGTNSSCHWCIR